MKSVGIVRRVDDLGRVVIPREIRKMYHIEEGDPLEIFLNDDGILFKKYSSMKSVFDFAEEYAKAIHETLNLTVCIADTDKFIYSIGNGSATYNEQLISYELSEIIKLKLITMLNSDNKIEITKYKCENHHSGIISPIIKDGDGVGAVIILSYDSNIPVNASTIKVANIAANFLSKQLNF